MRKNKNFTIALGGGVILLWIFVLYKFYKSFWGDSSVAVIKNDRIEKAVIKKETNNSFVLKLDYRDPFSNKLIRLNTIPVVGNKTTAPVVPKVKPVKEKVDFSFIKYIGLIKNTENKKQVALVSIHGQEYMVSEGELIHEVNFLKNHKDSIQVSYMGAVSYLKKQ
jgi:hypothetical protein